MSQAAAALRPGAASAQARFLTRVYLHLFGALAALVAFEVALFRTGAAAAITRAIAPVPWLLILAAFMVVGWLASRAAWRLESPAAQYAALAVYVVANGLILVPLLVRAEAAAPGTIASAAQVTLLGAGILTLVVFVTGRDFSFLRSLLVWGGAVALVLIVAALLFGLRLGTWFSVAMIALAGASILYDTSKLLRRRHRRHVAAALGLFASTAMMFWYVLRLFSRARG